MEGMSAIHRLIPVLVLLFSLASCATPPAAPAPVPAPVPAPDPDVPVALSIEKVKVAPRGLESVALSFEVVAVNADARPIVLDSLAWDLSIDGCKAETSLPPPSLTLAPGASTRIVGDCLASIPASSRDLASFQLRARAVRRGAGGAPLETSVESSGRFPVIRPPVFSIVSIKIKKAELINTKFEVMLRVENPNAVPLRLTAMDYELFGERRLWTDGETAEPIPVGAKSAIEKKLKLVMNFINMKRDLLDQVIKLEIVDYRFKGKARIKTELPEYPEFVMPFDLEGTTSVVE